MFTLKKQSAFSLIELIIVVTIIAVLASIAYISLSGESAQARDVRRLSDLKTLEDSVAMSNAQGRTVNYLSPITTNPAQSLKTSEGDIRVLRNAQMFFVDAGMIESTVLGTISRDPRGSPYLAAFISKNLFQFGATKEKPETQIAEAFITGAFKAESVIDNTLTSIDNNDRLLSVANAKQFITGDIISIDNEDMTVDYIDFTNNFIVVTRAVSSVPHDARARIILKQMPANVSSLFCIGALTALIPAVATGDLALVANDVPSGISILLTAISFDTTYTCSANGIVENGKNIILYDVSSS